MSSRTAIPATESVTASVGAPLDEIAAIARRRASTLTSDLGTDVLVQRTLERFHDTFGTTSCPLNLDGWIRRAMQEIATAPARRSRRADRSSVALSRILEGLNTPVRSPALTKQRKLLLRRVSELIGGPECRVVLAMSTARSLDRVGTQLGLSSIDVARLQQRGLLRLQTHLDHDPELMRQLTDAGRQPRRPRTNRR
jgi:DNA-directed RNA polymerase specialized sigma24 family protein